MNTTVPDPRPIAVELSPSAVEDLEAAVDWYLQEAGAAVAEQFLDAVATVMNQLRRFPQLGSPRWEQMLRLPGLRATLIEGFPHVVFHVGDEHGVEVLRVLHERRDLPEELAGDQ